jgi:uncharacterized repeat protein (TIGR03803 family)
LIELAPYEIFPGSIFKMTPDGEVMTLYSFCDFCPNGSSPSGLMQATDGNLYGTTIYGGGPGYGAIFKITPSGTLTTLYEFCSQSGCTDGAYPVAGLLQATNGNFYGTTTAGTDLSAGTIFRLSAGLRPFVTTLPAYGTVGESVKILGTDLTGATSVTFNGIAAAFEMVSRTEITATVPADATSGEVQVVATQRHAFQQRALPPAALGFASVNTCRPPFADVSRTSLEPQEPPTPERSLPGRTPFCDHSSNTCTR